MMPCVGGVVSENFYDNNLEHVKVSDGNVHLYFHSVQGKMSQKSTSNYCREESLKCIQILKYYERRNLVCQVLTFYEAQRRDVKRLDGRISVCCIDSYQGQEADVVILLLSVRKCKISKFMVNRGRLAVCTSRSKLDFHIVGHLKTICKSTIWRKLLSRFKKR